MKNVLLKNWMLMGINERVTSVKARLYTDVKIAGMEYDIGPLKLVNTLRDQNANIAWPEQAAIVLRLDLFKSEYAPSALLAARKSDAEFYSGGDFIDQIAALISLFMGIRLKAGPIDRDFPVIRHQFGRPILFGRKNVPKAVIATNPIIPQLKNNKCLHDLESLKSIKDASFRDVLILIKAARLYQEAVWISDADPNSSWILFASAIETVANEWARSGENQNIVQQLAEYMPDLFGNLLGIDYCKMYAIAKELNSIVKSTHKFVNFSLRFFPPDPAWPRPPAFFSFDFGEANARKAMKIIYGHRSKYLHEGISFPAPMCASPKYQKFPGINEEGYEERPSSAAYEVSESIWVGKDLPMMLHVFEYIARSCILNWWDAVRV